MLEKLACNSVNDQCGGGVSGSQLLKRQLPICAETVSTQKVPHSFSVQEIPISETVSFSSSMKVLKPSCTVSEQSHKAGLRFSNFVGGLQFQFCSAVRWLPKQVLIQRLVVSHGFKTQPRPLVVPVSKKLGPPSLVLVGLRKQS